MGVRYRKTALLGRLCRRNPQRALRFGSVSPLTASVPRRDSSVGVTQNRYQQENRSRGSVVEVASNLRGDGRREALRVDDLLDHLLDDDGGQLRAETVAAERPRRSLVQTDTAETTAAAGGEVLGGPHADHL